MSETEISKENNKTLENLNNKPLEIMNARVSTATCLISASFKITNPEHISEVKQKEDRVSNRVNDLLINKAILVILYATFLTFLDTDKKFNWKQIY